ncbi:hypothetical protein DFH11DRAFT_1613150 [Phellopilus nigrolimitatus]|nr:hypothetical protein DFH11DRAFT_1613150 [Phellopilus nigrolimitatus]
MLLSRSSTEPIDPELIPYLISDYRQELYYELAIVAALVYNIIITMDKEVKYFWSTPGAFVSLIYFLNRYAGFFSALATALGSSFHATERLCNFSTWSEYLADWVTILSMDYILLMRVLALYSQARKFAICLNTLFFIEAAFTLGNDIYSVIYEQVEVGEALGFAFCGLGQVAPPVFGTLYWSAPLLFELTLMSLALYKAAGFWRSSAGFGGINLVKVLIEDQAIYFISVMLCSAAKLTGYWADIPLDSNVRIFLALLSSTALVSVIGSRLMVHLKEAAAIGVNEGTSYRMKTLSHMEFA